MPLIEWKDSLSVGNPILDADHRRLMGLVNNFFEAWQGNTMDLGNSPLFDELLAYADGHFHREEQILGQRGYARLAEQRLAHMELRAEILLMRQKICDRDPTLTPEAVGGFLYSWLIDHIANEDKLYRPLFS